MAKIISIVGIVLVLLGGVLTYLTMQQKADLNTQLTDTKATLETTEGKLADETKVKEETMATLETTQTQLADEQKKVSETTAKLDTANSELAAAQAKVTETEAKVTELTAKTEELQSQVDRMPELSQQLAAATTDLASARTDLEAARAKILELETAVAQAPSGQGPAGQPGPGPQGGPTPTGIKGRVQAVNPGWGFVVLNVGEKDGVYPKAKLDVYRSGSKVGELEVSSVEPTLSTANVVDDASIEPGDQVITVTRS